MDGCQLFVGGAEAVQSSYSRVQYVEKVSSCSDVAANAQNRW